jgi:hypothetical protein
MFFEYCGPTAGLLIVTVWFGSLMLADGTMELHEVKGHWTDDARVKIKVAAEMYPFQFQAIRFVSGKGWEREEF